MGNVFSNLLGLHSSQNVTNPITGKDILPESKSLDPEAPLLGGDTKTGTTGKSSLLVDAAYTKKVSPGNYSSNSLLIR